MVTKCRMRKLKKELKNKIISVNEIIKTNNWSFVFAKMAIGKLAAEKMKVETHDKIAIMNVTGIDYKMNGKINYARLIRLKVARIFGHIRIHNSPEQGFAKYRQI